MVDFVAKLSSWRQLGPIMAVCIGAFSAQTATAATLSVTADTAIANSTKSVFNEYEDEAFSTDSNTIALNVADSSGAQAVTSTMSANAETGTLRMYASSAGNVVLDPEINNADSASVKSRVSMEEWYSVSGSGTMTVSMLIDGTWDFSTPPFSERALPDWFFGASVFVGASGGVSEAVCLGTRCTPSINQNSSGSLSDYLLEASIDIDTGDGTRQYKVFSDLYSNIIFANGEMDFGNTAKLFVSFGDGLTATANDPNFLSNPAFLQNTAPVPLPAGMWFMASAGLAMFGLSRRRRKT